MQASQHSIESDAVEQAMRSVAQAEIMPRFRDRSLLEISTKSPGELVTNADTRAEAALTTMLRAIADVPVIGEEAASATPELVDGIDELNAVWLLDPIDGTTRFAQGSEDFATMIAFVQNGETTHAWILHPATNDLITAERGGGAWRNGERLGPTSDDSPPSSQPITGLNGVTLTRFLPAEVVKAMEDNHQILGDTNPGTGSAGREYPRLAQATIDYILYWRTLPWDHAPGALVAFESGYDVCRLDGRPYRPGQQETGLLAAHPRIWTTVRDSLG